MNKQALENLKEKHNQDFENLKADYLRQLDETKAELNKIYATYHAAREAMLRETGTELSVIGHLTAEERLVWMENGECVELNLNGFTHF